jgi:hypothetical protein
LGASTAFADELLGWKDTADARMYLDTEGYVTAGVGCMLPNVASALLLPFVKNFSLAIDASM